MSYTVYKPSNTFRKSFYKILSLVMAVAILFIPFSLALNANAEAYEPQYTDLGAAKGYNLVTFGDFTMNGSDTEGYAMIGGTFSTSSGFGFGNKLNGKEEPGHILGGDIVLTSAASTRGTLSLASDATISSISMTDIISAYQNNTIPPQGVYFNSNMLLPKWKTSDAGMAALKPTKWLYEVMLKTDINFGILIAVILAIVVWVLLYRSTKGYELRSVGFNRDAAEFAGINVNRNITQAMLIAGALAGLAGALAITGTSPHKLSTMAAFENNGFNGLSVALIAGSSPIGCIFAGLLFGGLLYGGQSVQQDVGAPTEIINIMIGIIVFFVALTKVVPTLADKLEKRGAHRVK